MASVANTTQPQLAEEWNVQAQQEGYRIEPVNMLAQPKEVRLEMRSHGGTSYNSNDNALHYIVLR